MVLAAVGQMCSTANLAHNGQTVARLIQQAAQAGAKALFLPEAADYIAPNAAESVEIAQTVDKSPFVSAIRTALRALPSDRPLHVSVGVHEPTQARDRVRNTLLWLDPKGEIINRYQKVHMYDVDITNGPTLKESGSVEPGSSVVEPFATPLGKVGPAICYDIRFPEHSLRLRTLGADILVFPSAFTVKTGAAHWEALARARAIDTQTYVIMAAQVGKHDAAGKRQSYGHALVVDPWGTVIAQAPESDAKERLIFADIDLDIVETVRRDMPLWSQRRPDVYGYSV